MNQSPNRLRQISAIKWSTAVAVVGVAIIAAIVSYNHAYALVTEYSEGGWTARLVPLTVDGLIYASSLVLLHSARQGTPAPPLARWLLALGIAATLAANATHGLDRGPVGAIVAGWPAVALVGSYKLLMTRWDLAQLLTTDEADLWPELRAIQTAKSRPEIAAVHPRRSASARTPG